MPYFLSLFLFFGLSAWGIEVEVPQLTSPVMDLAGIFSEAEKQDLADFAYEIHTHQGPQITVLSVPTLNGFAIEDYSMAVAEKWQLGTKEAGNGLLVLIAKQERQVRIEVGDGIEGEVTDFETAKYTRDIFPKYFREGDFHGAIRLFMQDMAAKFNIKTEGQSSIVRRSPVRQTGGLNIAFMPFLIVFVILNLILRKRPGVRGITSGLAGAGIGWLLIPGLGLGVLAMFFIVAFLLGLIGINNLFHGGNYGGRGGGGFGGGGFGGGGGGGWGGGGGGFSGGGSSGSW